MAGDVVVHEYGDPGAPPMVLLHGLTEAGTTWPDAVEHWGAHWRMSAVDLRGHGDSPRFTDEELADTAAVVLADVLRVLDEVRRPVALVGHSYGALFALRAALARPDRVRGLVLEDPARPIDLRPPPPEFFEHQDRFLDAMLDPEPEIRRTRAETSWSEAEIHAWAACKPQVDRRLIHHLGLGPDRWRDLIGSVAVPTLLVVPRGEGAGVRTANTAVTIARIPGVGHCIRRDDPAAYFGVVDPFLAGLGG